MKDRFSWIAWCRRLEAVSPRPWLWAIRRKIASYLAARGDRAAPDRARGGLAGRRHPWTQEGEPTDLDARPHAERPRKPGARPPVRMLLESVRDPREDESSGVEGPVPPGEST